MGTKTRTKLDKIMKKQKHSVYITHDKDNFIHLEPLMRNMNAFNVHHTNIFQVLKFTCNAKHNLNPRVFNNTFT